MIEFILVKGAGTVSRLIHEYFPKQKMQGWELDPDIIDLGRKHMELNTLEESGVLVSKVKNTLNFDYLRMFLLEIV